MDLAASLPEHFEEVILRWGELLKADEKEAFWSGQRTGPEVFA